MMGAVAVAVGGAAGSLLRYWATLAAALSRASSAWATAVRSPEPCTPALPLSGGGA